MGTARMDAQVGKVAENCGHVQLRTEVRIHISLLYLQNTSWGENVDTLLHELAHARTPGAHHGPVWKNAAVEMGCTGKRCCNAFDQPAYLGGMLSEAGRC